MVRALIALAFLSAPVFAGGPPVPAFDGGIGGFDIHEPTGRAAVLRYAIDGYRPVPTLAVVDLRTGRIVAEGKGRNGRISEMPSTIRFSPDGRLVSFVARGDSTRQAVFVLDVATGESRPVFDRAGYTVWYDVDWSVDGKKVLFIAARNSGKPLGARGMCDVGWSIYELDLSTRSPVARVLSTDGNTNVPSYAPSGREIAFESTYCLPETAGRNERWSFLRVGLVNRTDAEIRWVPRSDAAEHRVSRRPWSSDGRYLVVREREFSAPESARDREVGRRLRIVRMRDLATVRTWEHPAIVEAGFTPDGRLWCVTEREVPWRDTLRTKAEDCILRFAVGRDGLPSAAPADTIYGWSLAFGGRTGTTYTSYRGDTLWRWDASGEKVAMLDGRRQELPRLVPQKVVITTRDGLTIPYYRYLPARLDPRHPVVFYLLGGPGGPVIAEQPEIYALLDAGYEVVIPAYRGTHVPVPGLQHPNRDLKGEKDVSDVIDCGLDFQRRFGDGRPLALFGISYGGYLTYLALTRGDAPFVCGIPESAPLHVSRSSLPVGLDSTARETLFRERSALWQADRISRPLFIAYGEEDNTASLDEMRVLRDRVAARGIRCDLKIYEGDTHALFDHTDEFIRDMRAFLSAFDRPQAASER